MTCGTVVPRTVQANGQEASFGPGGTIIEIRDATRGMTIECGLHPADRKIVTEGNGRTLVSTGPTGGYLQRPFYRDRYGRSYVQRTYWVNEHAYAYAYRDLYYGVHYYRYAPAYYYHPVFYSWAFNPWAAPVHYNWGWGAAPWFYGDYFTPEPYYPTASLWLTDYLLAENLKLAYENQRVAQGNPQPSRTGEPPQPREIASTAAAPLGPEVKRMVETEVRRELEAERAAAQAPQGQAAYTDQVPPPALDPKQRLFVVSADLGVSTSAGRECELTPGDVIIRVENTPGRDAKVEVRVLSCKSRDCRVDSSPRVGVTDLQEMYNSFCERLAAGLQALANNQGKGGLPPAPDTDTLQGEVPPPVPDANAGDMLQDQRKEAMQLEAEVEQQVKMGQGLNELATSPAAVPTAQGADNRAAASSQSASKGAKNPNVLRVPGGHGVRRQPPMHAPVHSMGPARPATSQQQSKPAVPAPQGPHP